MKKRWISLLLAAALLLGLWVPVSAGGVPRGSISDELVNPLFEDVPEPAPSAEEPETSDDLIAPRNAADYVTSAQASELLRTAMLERRNNFDIYIKATAADLAPGIRGWLNNTVIPTAYSQALARCPYDGDYLQWSWRRCKWNAEYEGYYFTVHFAVTYHAEAAYEQQVPQALDRLAQQLGIAGMEPYDAYDAIYEHLIRTVYYDEETLARVDQGTASDEDYQIYSAYGALINHRAVCQGISMLYYALCWKVGLPVRVITGSNHAWNIVYLKDTWYNIDPTWDGNHPDDRTWFLRGSISFDPRHGRDAEFLTEDFLRRYSVSPFDYDYDLPYNDVGPNNVHYANILRATELGLFNGTSTYTFSPAQAMDRAMLVTVLWRMEGKPAATKSAGFTDVPENAYYAQAVDWAAETGIVQGFGEGIFSPNTKATREQLVTFLWRYAGYLGADTRFRLYIGNFTDWDQLSDYAVEPMGWAVYRGLVNGTSTTTVSPGANATREQLASILVRMIDQYDLK